MQLHHQESKTLSVKKILLSTLTLGILAFVGFNLYPLLHGPKLEIKSIADTTPLDHALITVSGKAKFTQELFINGALLSLSPNGTFEKKIVLSEGYNTLTVSGVDRYGKTQVKEYALVLDEENVNLTLLAE